MSSWLIIITLMLLLIVNIGMLLLFHWDIKKMTNQLEVIIENFGTNELVRTNTHSKSLIRFAAKINQLIQLFKEDQQYTHRREKELKQEITNISHDLRTPLTSIKGFSELLTDRSLSETEKEEFLAIIQKKIDNLTMMVDLFYELSQIDSADKQLIMEQQFLDQLVVEAMLLFYDDFEKSQLRIHVDEVVLPPIIADKKATNRIVTNIIQNALRYAKSYLTITLIEDEKYVWLRAINDVTEFNRTEINRIFDRTFRLDNSRTAGHLGLGLHIVRQLINKQGGKVVADVHKNEFRIDVAFKKWN
ncbi:sensor histidine kinase [Oceanobacillus profundus]|uniref:histidine kinase n=2 Tax=Oceanobacillus profundus TaxID=372463 RepID=A0A417YBS3_9BACI|nr:HAMP domain-containing sensor histidine kinase [Oceanobacillus profundus]PAE27996.1 sensor histidine kinase [Paenibacillus sp. 7884-2]RHW30139.1 sensor histidine kinase [Oceanobacillus profundus]